MSAAAARACGDIVDAKQELLVRFVNGSLTAEVPLRKGRCRDTARRKKRGATTARRRCGGEQVAGGAQEARKAVHRLARGNGHADDAPGGTAKREVRHVSRRVERAADNGPIGSIEEQSLEG